VAALLRFCDTSGLSHWTPSGLSMDECRSRVLETVAPLSAETVAQRMSDYLKLMDAVG